MINSGPKQQAVGATKTTGRIKRSKVGFPGGSVGGMCHCLLIVFPQHVDALGGLGVQTRLDTAPTRPAPSAAARPRAYAPRRPLQPAAAAVAAQAPWQRHARQQAHSPPCGCGNRRSTLGVRRLPDHSYGLGCGAQPFRADIGRDIVRLLDTQLRPDWEVERVVSDITEGKRCEFCFPQCRHMAMCCR